MFCVTKRDLHSKRVDGWVHDPEERSRSGEPVLHDFLIVHPLKGNLKLG